MAIPTRLGITFDKEELDRVIEQNKKAPEEKVDMDDLIEKVYQKGTSPSHNEKSFVSAQKDDLSVSNGVTLRMGKSVINDNSV